MIATTAGPMPSAEPVFESTHNALRFAFEYSPEQYGEGTLASLLKRAAGLGSGKGLVGLDGAAQAGMILAEVWRLDGIQRSAIIARYGQRKRECKCCGGAAMSDEWKIAVEALTHWAVPTGLSNYRVRREIIGRYFLRSGETVKALAQKWGVDRATLGEQIRIIEKKLKDSEARAQTSMDDVLKRTGVVESA